MASCSSPLPPPPALIVMHTSYTQSLVNQYIYAHTYIDLLAKYYGLVLVDLLPEFRSRPLTLLFQGRRSSRRRRGHRLTGEGGERGGTDKLAASPLQHRGRRRGHRETLLTSRSGRYRGLEGRRRGDGCGF